MLPSTRAPSWQGLRICQYRAGEPAGFLRIRDVALEAAPFHLDRLRGLRDRGKPSVVGDRGIVLGSNDSRLGLLLTELRREVAGLLKLLVAEGVGDPRGERREPAQLRGLGISRVDEEAGSLDVRDVAGDRARRRRVGVERRSLRVRGLPCPN